MTKIFPEFASHETASCFHCGSDFDGSYWSKDEAAAGRGEFFQHCEKCRMSTWYDIAVGDRTHAPSTQTVA
jgi:hypothetical protein